MSNEIVAVEAPIDFAQAIAPADKSRSWLDRLVGYGWAPIIVGAIAMTATYPGRTHGLGMITEPLLADLQLATPEGRVFYSSLNLWGTLIGALFCLPMGWLFDRLDRRPLLAGNLILLGISVVWMSTVTNWQQLFAGIILTRGLGQSALSVVSLTIVAKSFDAARLGIAMAWYSIMAVPCHIFLIKAVGWALTDAHYGWRSIWSAIGLSLIGLAVSAVFLSPSTHRPSASANSNAEGSTLREALATPAFWVFGLTIALWGMIYAGVALFNVDIFNERGFSDRLYFNVLSLVTLVALCSKFLFGWLSNYVSLSRLLAACLFVTALCLISLPLASQVWHAYAYGVGLGIASGAVTLLFFAAWGKLYGQRELGRIQGFAQMLTVIASACGPLIFSFGKHLTDSYTSVFQALAAIVLAMAFLAWFTPLPQPSSQKALA